MIIKILYCDVMGWPIGYSTNGYYRYFEGWSGKRNWTRRYPLAPCVKLNTSNS